MISEGSPEGTRSLLWWKGFVEKEGFELGVKEWGCDGCWEWWWWQRWLDKWMRRWIATRLARLTKWIWKLIPKTRWCISEWMICYFQWGDGWWARRGDSRWEAGTARRLKRSDCEDTYRLGGSKNFVDKREKFISSTQQCVRRMSKTHRSSGTLGRSYHRRSHLWGTGARAPPP